MHCVLVLVAREPVPVAVDELVELQLEEQQMEKQQLVTGESDPLTPPAALATFRMSAIV